jgi:twinfilin-like protein
MNMVSSVSESGTFEEDLSELQSHFDPNAPCYVLARTDKKNNRDQWRWNLFCYVPDKAKVREKMIYASSRSSLRQQLGDDFFVDEIFGTVPADFNLQGYNAHVQHRESDDPLTREEVIIKEEREQGIFVGGGGSGIAYSHGVAFPIDGAVNSAMDQFVNGGVNYVQLTIDIDAERILLCHSQTVTVDDLPNYLPNDEPRFHFFKYDHEHEGENFSSTVYIYSCPDGSNGTVSAPVKMRMLFSTSKSNVSSILTSRGVSIDKVMEVNNGQDVVVDELITLLHPQKEVKKKINKPTPRGGRKLIRN